MTQGDSGNFCIFHCNRPTDAGAMRYEGRVMLGGTFIKWPDRAGEIFAEHGMCRRCERLTAFAVG